MTIQSAMPQCSGINKKEGKMNRKNGGCIKNHPVIAIRSCQSIWKNNVRLLLPIDPSGYVT